MSVGVAMFRNWTCAFLAGKWFQCGWKMELFWEFVATSRNDVDFLSQVFYFVAHSIISMGPGPLIANNQDQPASSAPIFYNCLVDQGKLASGL
jgi:hypothetical protein